MKVAEAAPPATLHDVNHRLAIIHKDAIVSPLAVVGAPAEWHDHDTRFPAALCADVVVREFARVHAGCERHTLIGQGTLLMAGSHIGHDTRIGEDCDVAPNAVVGGCCTVGDRVKIGMGAVVKPHVTIGDGARIGAGAVVTRDVPAGETWAGVPAKCVHRRQA